MIHVAILQCFNRFVCAIVFRVIFMIYVAITAVSQKKKKSSPVELSEMSI